MILNAYNRDFGKKEAHLLYNTPRSQAILLNNVAESIFEESRKNSNNDRRLGDSRNNSILKNIFAEIVLNVLETTKIP